MGVLPDELRLFRLSLLPYRKQLLQVFVFCHDCEINCVLDYEFLILLVLLFYSPLSMMYIPSWKTLVSLLLILVNCSIDPAVWPVSSLSFDSTITLSPSTFTLAPSSSLNVLGDFSPKKFFTIKVPCCTETFIGKCPEHIFSVYLNFF